MKWFVFILSIICSIHIYAGETSDDNTRYISTDFEWIKIDFSDTHPLGISLNAVVTENKVLSYSLTIRKSSIREFRLPEKGLLLFKCLDGTVIESNQQDKGYNTHRTEGYDAISFLKHVVIGEYPITKSNLDRIAIHGLTKVRLETMDGFIDIEYSKRKTKKIARVFSQLMSSLEELIKVKGNIRREDIRSGF